MSSNTDSASDMQAADDAYWRKMKIILLSVWGGVSTLLVIALAIRLYFRWRTPVHPDLEMQRKLREPAKDTLISSQASAPQRLNTAEFESFDFAQGHSGLPGTSRSIVPAPVHPLPKAESQAPGKTKTVDVDPKQMPASSDLGQEERPRRSGIVDSHEELEDVDLSP
ncbi:hypothetical protein F4677DRAFT_447825 [Hypoxylon crocopeplum]|nr:hypothetical protein F4677DRAFT_447825 [Hypoxylon crocopeplum]